MVNTLRRKKDKETPAAVVDSSSSMNLNSSPLSGLASISTTTPPPTELQTTNPSTSIEENNRTVAAPLKVHVHYIFIFSSLFAFITEAGKHFKVRQFSFFLIAISVACIYLSSVNHPLCFITVLSVFDIVLFRLIHFFCIITLSIQLVEITPVYCHGPYYDDADFCFWIKNYLIVF